LGRDGPCATVDEESGRVCSCGGHPNMVEHFAGERRMQPVGWLGGIGSITRLCETRCGERGGIEWFSRRRQVSSHSAG
jgi:hypothetical protein